MTSVEPAMRPSELFVQPPPGVPLGRSSYIDYLPGLYQSDEFLARFLLVFEHVLSPIQRTVENLPHYFDPHLVPESLLEWLGTWVGLVLDPRWPESRRRHLLASASTLYGWRGTKRGLSELIRLYTGVEPEIQEAVEGSPFQFAVRLALPGGESIDEELLRNVIELQKPAWAAYTLELTGAAAASESTEPE